MGKQGPCHHCGVTSTPLWRNGPPDKPVLCNACGSRWRTKGSLANYTPMHRKDDDEPRVSRLKPPTSKSKSQKKKSNHIIMENEPFSGQNFQKMGGADPSNWSSSGSAVSYSESRVAEMTGSAQSHAWESLVPSRKRSCVTRPKPSSVEKLAKDLNSIMHEEQLYYLSGSSEEDLLYHSETPVGSFEIGSGSVLLRHPNSKSLEEESEASSIPADNKSYITSESYSGSVSFVSHSGNKAAINLNAATVRPKRSLLRIEDNGRRDKLHYENQHILESVDSPLVSADLEEKEIKETRGVENISGSKGFTKSTIKPVKRSRDDNHFQSDSDGTMRSPLRVLKSGALMTQFKNSSLPKSGYATKDSACTGGALNLFMLPPEKLSLFVPPQYANSDQDLLLEIPLNARHPEAELLCQPSQLSSITHISTSVGGVAEGEGHLKQP
ncbi:GATA transcription factor 26-like [Miscanthus floridulus]|uniref:GATA transcription factor 26-like n=1 Tax=Miscanthus floridulus TaxID=154761 RepID=UPI003459B0C9